MILGGAPLAATPLGGQAILAEYEGIEYVPVVSVSPSLYAPYASPYIDFVPTTLIEAALFTPNGQLSDRPGVVTITPTEYAPRDSLALHVGNLLTLTPTLYTTNLIYQYAPEDARMAPTQINDGGLTMTPTNKRLTRTEL